MTILKRPINVFLVHTHRDKEAVHDLYACLAKNGIKAWLDAKSLLPGQDWRHEIRRSILMSDIALFVCQKVLLDTRGFARRNSRSRLKRQIYFRTVRRLLSLPVLRNATPLSLCAAGIAWTCLKRMGTKNLSAR